jgi:hypothetical protein
MVACSTSPPSVPAAPAGPPPPRSRSIPDRDWTSIEVESAQLLLPLPDRGGWARLEGSPSAVWLAHRASGTVLRVRGWLERRSVTAAECAERATLAWPHLPVLDSPGVLDRRPLLAPTGYRGWVTLTVARAGSSAIEGRLGAVGAGPGRCFALELVTRAGGPGADRVVGETLALFAAGSVDRLTRASFEDWRPSPAPRR